MSHVLGRVDVHGFFTRAASVNAQLPIMSINPSCACECRLKVEAWYLHSDWLNVPPTRNSSHVSSAFFPSLSKGVQGTSVDDDRFKKPHTAQACMPLNLYLRSRARAWDRVSNASPLSWRSLPSSLEVD